MCLRECVRENNFARQQLTWTIVDGSLDTRVNVKWLTDCLLSTGLVHFSLSLCLYVYVCMWLCVYVWKNESKSDKEQHKMRWEITFYSPVRWWPSIAFTRFLLHRERKKRKWERERKKLTQQRWGIHASMSRCAFALQHAGHLIHCTVEAGKWFVDAIAWCNHFFLLSHSHSHSHSALFLNAHTAACVHFICEFDDRRALSTQRRLLTVTHLNKGQHSLQTRVTCVYGCLCVWGREWSKFCSFIFSSNLH